MRFLRSFLQTEGRTILVDTLALVAAVSIVLSQLPPTEAKLKYSILEERDAGTFIANLFTDNGFQESDSESINSLKFRFLSRSTLGSFDLDEKTGVLRTAERFDRDQLCPSANRCQANMDVVAATNSRSVLSIMKVQVEIRDQNDNAPQFAESRVTKSIIESAAIGSSIVIPTASDPDSERYSVQRYELNPSSFIFRLDTTTKLDGSKEVRLVLTRQLDHERQNSYRLRVVATDGGVPPRTGTLDVRLLVLDANDNSPEFENTTYTVEVPESLPLHSALVTVRASDRDTGVNGKILYTFTSRTLSLYGHLFAIDNITGTITVRSVLDYELGDVYHLSVQAHDRGPDALPADATVVVRLRDVNDHAPKIVVNTLQAAATDSAVVSEDAPPRTFVAHVTVEDRDHGKNGRFNCTLLARHFALESLETGAFQLLTRAPLNRELQASYGLAVTCRDHGDIPQVTVKHVQVNVADVNDNAPVFQSAQYACELMENNVRGTFITKVNATDADEGNNGRVRYSIIGAIPRDLFNVDSVSGAITSDAVFDHERHPELRFHVLAEDHGKPSRNGTTLVVVKVKDVNDEPPIFQQRAYSFSVAEHEPVGAAVGTVRAMDADSAPYNRIAYRLAERQLSVGKFSVNATTGKITTLVELDRERTHVYYVVVVAVDADSEHLSSSVTATVNVDDKNDHAPTFKFPSSRNYTLYVSSYAPIGYGLAKIVATDLDIGENGNLSFRFRPAPPHALFRVDPTSGVVSVSASLSRIDYERFNMTIEARDRGKTALSSEASLEIVVNRSFPLRLIGADGSGSMLSGHNLTIVVSLACVSALVMLILLVAIVLIRRQDSSRKHNHKYNCRMEALKILQHSPNASPSKKPNNSTAVGKDGLPPPPPPPTSQHANCDYHQRKENCLSQSGSVSNVTSAHVVALQASPKHRSSPNNNVSTRPWTLTQKELEVHHLLEMLKEDQQDADSAYSGETCNTDSGRGASDEGEAGKQRLSTGSHNLPPYPDGSSSPRSSQLPLQPPPPPPAYSAYGGQPRLHTFAPRVVSPAGGSGGPHARLPVSGSQPNLTRSALSTGSRPHSNDSRTVHFSPSTTTTPSRGPPNGALCTAIDVGNSNGLPPQHSLTLPRTTGGSSESDPWLKHSGRAVVSSNDVIV